jgi:hypothetical protein
MRDAYENGTFEHKGRTYSYWLHVDGSMRAPWIEHDGHGPVREVTGHISGDSLKRPGERILTTTRWGGWLYDWQEATKIAKRDRWGISPEHVAILAKNMGRAPTRKEIIRAAVQADFEYLQGWLNDEWHWCWLEVRHSYMTAEKQWLEDWETLSGLQSDDDKYLDECRRQLADQIASRLDDIVAAEIIASRPDMQPGFHP